MTSPPKLHRAEVVEVIEQPATAQTPRHVRIVTANVTDTATRELVRARGFLRAPWGTHLKAGDLIEFPVRGDDGDLDVFHVVPPVRGPRSR